MEWIELLAATWARVDCERYMEGFREMFNHVAESRFAPEGNVAAARLGEIHGADADRHDRAGPTPTAWRSSRNRVAPDSRKLSCTARSPDSTWRQMKVALVGFGPAELEISRNH